MHLSVQLEWKYKCLYCPYVQELNKYQIAIISQTIDFGGNFTWNKKIAVDIPHNSLLWPKLRLLRLVSFGSVLTFSGKFFGPEAHHYFPQNFPALLLPGFEKSGSMWIGLVFLFVCLSTRVSRSTGRKFPFFYRKFQSAMGPQGRMTPIDFGDIWPIPFFCTIF